MPKRVLTVRNQADQPSSSSTIVTRSSAKRLKNDETTTNIPKEENKENQNEPIDDPTTSNDENDDQPLNKEYVLISEKNSPPIIVSKTALYWSSKYLKVIQHVYPDSYGMHIHNDFSCYGELEIVENCLLDLTKAIFFVQQRPKTAERVNYVLAFRRLEALTILLDNTIGMSGIDDGDRFDEIMRVIAACYVTILRGLLPKEIFQILTQVDQDLVKKLEKIAKKIPNFAQVLEKSLIVGYSYLQIGDIFSSYTNILRIIYLNWLLLMENRTINLNSSAPKGKQELWQALKQAAEIEKNGTDQDETETFNFLEELQNYKRNHHRMGGDSHDLRKWSKAERNEYSYDRLERFWSF